MFDEKFEAFLAEQRKGATGARLERLNKPLTAEKKMLEAAIWPVLQSFDDLVLEYELVSLSGVKIYIDVFYRPIRAGFESEGFAVHAGEVSRSRFDFERMRVRTMALKGIMYVPFSWDQLERQPESCRRYVYELIGKYSATKGNVYEELTVHEREVLRYSLYLRRPLRLRDVCYCLQLKEDAVRSVVRALVQKELLKPCGQGKLRVHEYQLTEKAAKYHL